MCSCANWSRSSKLRMLLRSLLRSQHASFLLAGHITQHVRHRHFPSPNNCLNRPPLPLPRRLCFLCSGALPTGLIFEAVACVESMHRNRIGRVSGSGSMNRLRDLSIGRQRSIPTLDCRQSFKGKEGFSPRTSQTFVLSLLQHELLDA